MKKFYKFIILLVIIIFCSCLLKFIFNDNQSINQSINKSNDSLKIIGINMPSYLPNLINKDEFNDLDYNITESNKIEVIFNNDIIDKDYILGYMQYANYYGIKNNFDKEKHIF